MSFEYTPVLKGRFVLLPDGAFVQVSDVKKVVVFSKVADSYYMDIAGAKIEITVDEHTHCRYCGYDTAVEWRDLLVEAIADHEKLKGTGTGFKS